MTDFGVVGPDEMQGGTQRPVQSGDKSAAFAEDMAFFMFAYDFLQRYPAGLVFSQSKYSTPTWLLPAMGPLLKIAVGALDKDFKNAYSKTLRNLNKVDRRVAPDKLNKGGRRKADGLGVAADDRRGTVICELLEVSTKGQASSTMTEDLGDKLDILRGPVKTTAEDGIKNFAERASTPFHGFAAFGTPFIPPLLFRQWPLPSSLVGAGSSSKEIEWVSYWPTCQYRPCSIAANDNPFTGALEPEDSPARGLVLYNIYKASPDRVPVFVAEKLRDAIMNTAGWKLNWQMQLVPVVTNYWKENPDQLRLWLGYVAAGALVAGILVLAVYLAPLVVEAGLAAAVWAGTTGAAVLEQSAAVTFVTQYATLMRAAYTAAATAYSVAGQPMPQLGSMAQ